MQGERFPDRSAPDALTLIAREDEKGTDALLEIPVEKLAPADVDRADSGAV